MSDTLHGRFLRGLSISPDGTAVRTAGTEISYSELHRTALELAGALLAGERPAAVGVLAAKGVEAYAGILAGLYAGVTVVPLQPAFPAARTAAMIEAAGVTAVIADDPGRARLREIEELVEPGRAVPRLVEPGGEPLTDPVSSTPGSVSGGAPGGAPDDVAYILFTSGSTGRPKGVTITHGNTAHYFALLDARYDFTAADVFTQVFDLNFDCAMFDLFCAWGAGATAVVVPPSAYRDIPGFLAEQGVTVWFSTPSAISLVRRMGGLRPGSMPGLRWSFFAGEALRCEDAAEWARSADRSTVENIYGPTELTITVSGHRWSPERTPGLAVNGVVPIGRIHDGHEYRLLEETDGEGELCISGPQLTPGYLDPADGEGRFTVLDGRTFYRTGDRVRRLPGGELAYLGRLDAQVQVNGLRVELAEIEHALRGCAGVAEAVVVGVGEEGAIVLHAFHTGERTAAARLAGEMRALLPEQMIPRHFRHLDEMPLNSNRKIDRPRLREWAVKGVPRGTASELAAITV
ncbi:amino acid adenylation protein [Planobispora rosea]|uniref:Amino acid adenylation protein n=1 Tax=Planobispora rosea TaxID=35762 RepID=A0A8J3WD06_PLARO|nr:AMP-binding protein [Planobispora rosea]GGS59445.1 amino acid adenylation protein [Planobispora rosea]GIH84618.1 amino acid adenylation protein [Planobispora rosea]